MVGFAGAPDNLVLALFDAVRDGVFEGSQILLLHAAKNVDVAGIDAASKGSVIPELHLVVGIASCHFSRVVASHPGDKLVGRVGSAQGPAGAIRLL